MAGEPRAGSWDARATWLVLASDGSALDLNRLTPIGTSVRILSDPTRFLDVLVADRPRITVLAEPPATLDERTVLAQERRRRRGLRIIHLSAGANLDGRLAAPRSRGVGYRLDPPLTEP